MNLMILSPGRRVEVVQYFKKELHKTDGKVFTLDMSPYSPALYEGDEAFVIKKDFNNLDSYIDNIIDICVKNNINSIITLIDPELVLLAQNRKKFLDNNIFVILSDLDEILFTFDKYKFAKELKDKINVIPTYNEYSEIRKALDNNEVEFPIFAKIRDGSGSAGIGELACEEELLAYKDKKNYIFQPCVKEKEFGIDVYFDMIDGKIKTFFIKEKLNMRAGETDKSISLFREDIAEIIFSLEELGFKGPIDVDIFEDKDGKLYVNEINPRFGGGYSHAYNAGVDFIELIINNLNGNINGKSIGNYEEDLVMLKYNGTKFINKNELKFI